jgi:hypothetical protein
MQQPVYADNATIFGDGTEEHPLSAGGATTITVASGTAAMGTAEINSAAAGSTVSVAAAEVLATDNVMADFNSNPTGVTGYEPGAMLTIVKWCSSGFVNFLQVNNTASNITPNAVTLNWRVVR